MTSDPHWPENALAFEETAFRRAVEAARLRVRVILAGQWRPEPTYAGGQDLLVVERAD